MIAIWYISFGGLLSQHWKCRFFVDSTLNSLKAVSHLTFVIEPLADSRSYPNADSSGIHGMVRTSPQILLLGKDPVSVCTELKCQAVLTLRWDRRTFWLSCSRDRQHNTATRDQPSGCWDLNIGPLENAVFDFDVVFTVHRWDQRREKLRTHQYLQKARWGGKVALSMKRRGSALSKFCTRDFAG